MKKSIFIALAFFAAVFIIQSCGNRNSNTDKKEADTTQTKKADTMDMNKMNNDMMQAMNGTLDKMKDMKMTGNFDLDFANTMIMHHQAAIDMSEVEVSKGGETQVKMMAQNIITAQKAEIAQMEQWVKDFKMPEVKKENVEMHNELAESMKAMMDKMKGMSMTGNTDKDFVMMMIPHHESAITMAKDELSHGKNHELKQLAQKIIADQNKEVIDFKAWLASQK